MCSLETKCSFLPTLIQQGDEMKLRPLLVTCVMLALASAAFGRQAAQPSAAATARITKEVRHELVMLPYFSVFDNLAYKVDGYNVTLMGQVTKPTLKSDAENVVKRMKAVNTSTTRSKSCPCPRMTIAFAASFIVRSTAIPRCRGTPWECNNRSGSL